MFFALHGIADYRLAESGGATEGAPAAGAAELVVDITTTGATLAANGLKVLADGLILKSQAHLAAALGAEWSEANQSTCRRLLSIFGARSRAKRVAGLTWPSAHEAAAQRAVGPFVETGAPTRAHGALVEQSKLFAAATALAAAGVGPVSVAQPAYVFHADCPEADRLRVALEGRFDRHSAG